MFYKSVLSFFWLNFWLLSVLTCASIRTTGWITENCWRRLSFTSIVICDCFWSLEKLLSWNLWFFVKMTLSVRLRWLYVISWFLNLLWVLIPNSFSSTFWFWRLLIHIIRYFWSIVWIHAFLGSSEYTIRSFNIPGLLIPSIFLDSFDSFFFHFLNFLFFQLFNIFNNIRFFHNNIKGIILFLFLYFSHGAIFYCEENISLFFWILFRKYLRILFISLRILIIFIEFVIAFFIIIIFLLEIIVIPFRILIIFMRIFNILMDLLTILIIFIVRIFIWIVFVFILRIFLCNLLSFINFILFL